MLKDADLSTVRANYTAADSARSPDLLEALDRRRSGGGANEAPPQTDEACERFETAEPRVQSTLMRQKLSSENP